MRKLALGLFAAGSIMVAAPAHSQGFWFGAPGFGIGIGTGYGYGPYYSDASWGPAWEGRGYSSYAYAPAYTGYDNYAYAPGYGYEPSFTYADPGYAYAYEPTYEQRYVYTSSARSPRYTRAYVPGYASARTYRNSYAFSPSYRTRHVYSHDRTQVRSANVIRTRSERPVSQTVGSSVRTDPQPSLRYRARRAQD